MAHSSVASYSVGQHHQDLVGKRMPGLNRPVVPRLAPSHPYTRRHVHRVPPCSSHSLQFPSNMSPAESSIDLDADAWDQRYSEPLYFGTALLQGPREAMEDYTMVVPRGRCGYLFAAVFDGHGGHQAADYLSQALYDNFSKAVTAKRLEKNPSLPENLPQLLQTCFANTDKAVQKHLAGLAPQDPEAHNSGATATVALVREDKLVVANIGDSRAVLCRNSTAVDLSAEHRLYGRGAAVEEEVQRIESLGGWIVDGRICDILAVSRAFGDVDFKGPGLQHMLETGVKEGMWTQEFADSVQFKGDLVICEPDVVEETLTQEDDFLIVASDGLWDVMKSEDAVAWASKQFARGMHAQEVAQDLAKLAVKRYTSDNVAVVVVDLKRTGQPGAAGAKAQKKGLFGWF